jgi:hypothetical protein
MSPNHWFARILRRQPLRRSPGPSVRPRLTALEDRLAPATLDLLAGGTLVYTGANVANSLAFSLAGGTYSFNDPLDPITLGPGAIGAGYTTSGDTASGPAGGVTGIAINLGSAANSLTLGTFDEALPALSVTSAGIAGSTAGVSGPLTSTGPIGLDGFEAITLAGAVTAAGDVTIRSDGLDIQQPLSAGANRVTIAPATAGRAVNLGGPDSATELGLIDAELDFVTAGNLSIGAVGTGTIAVTSAVSQTGSGYTLLALTSDGAIAGAGGSIAVDSLALASATGISLVTQASNLSFLNTVSGPVSIANTGGLTLQPVAGLSNSANAGSTVDIATSGAMLVAQNIDSPGSITLTTVDAAGPGQGLLVNAGASVHSTGGDVVLRAGDDLGLSAGSLVQSAGTIGLAVDFGDADPGVGGNASVPGATLSAPSAALTGGADDDIFNLSASATTPLAVNGGAGANTLNFDALGNPITIDPTAITVTGAQPVTYTSIEAILLINATTVALQGTTADDAFTLIRTPSGVVATINGGPAIVIGELPLTINGLSGTNSLLLDFSGGSPIPAGGLTLLNLNQYQLEGTAGDDVVDLQRAGGLSQFRLNGGAFFDLPGVTAFRFDGLAGSDTLHVFYAGGDPVPVAGVTFDGGPGSDTLGVFGVGNSATYRPSATTPGDGTVTVDAGTIAFANLTPVDITGMATATVILPGADDVLAVDNGFDFTSGGATPALRVSGASGGVAIETAALWNNTTVVIDTRAVDGNDTIAVNSATVGNNTNLTIATGTGNDTVAVGAGGILLAGQSSIASGTITVSGPITSTGASGGITFTNTGTLAIGGVAIASQGPIVQNGAGPVAITGNASVTTNTGAILFQSPVVFGAGVAATFVSTGNAPISVGSTLDGGGNVTVTTGGLTTFAGAIGGGAALGSLTTNGGGVTAINGGLVSTTGLQQYSDNVTVGAASTLFTSSGNGAITFGGTLDGPSVVTVTTGGMTTFTGPVGGTTALISLMTAGGGTTAVNGGLVRTSGAQEFDDAVTLGAAATQFASTGNGPITFRSTLDGASAVSVTTAGLTNFVGAVGGSTPLTSLTTNGGGSTAINGGLVRTTGAHQFSDAVAVGTAAATLFTSIGNAAITFGGTLDGASAVTVTTGGPTTFAGPVGSAIALTSLTTNGGGTTAVNGGLVRTTGAQLYSDAVTVVAATTQFVSIGAGAITFASTLNGAAAVTVTSAGLIAFFGAVGGVTPLISLSTVGGGTTDLNAGIVTTVGDQNYAAPVILTANTVLTAANVTFAQTLNSDGTPRSLLVNASGVTNFGGAVGNTQRLASLTTDAPGATRINGGLVNTVGSQTYGDAVTLSFGSAGATTTTLIASAVAPGGITFANTLNGATPRNQVLQLLANAGDVNFGGPVGGAVELGQVTISSAHNVTVGATFIAFQFLQTTGTGTTAFNGAMALSAVGAVDVTNQIITLSQPIIAGVNGASVRLNGTVGGVTQTGGAVLAGAGTTAAGRDGALVLNGAGAFTLDQPGNDVAYFAAFVTGPVTYRDANDLTIIPGGGVHTNGGAITLTTGRNFTAVDTNFAVPLLDAGAGVIQVNPGQLAGAVVTLNAEVRGSVVTFGTDLGAPRSNALPDLFVIRPSRNIAITVKGNRPSPLLADPIPPGDRLQPIFAGINGRLVLTPTGLGQGFYTFPDDTVKPLTFFEIENLVGFSVSAYSVQTGPTSYGIRTINQQLGQTIQGGISGGQVPANPFVVAPAIVNPFGPFGAPRIVFGDVNGDGTADLIIGNGPNNPPLVTVINGTALLGVNNVSLSDPANVLAQFFAYNPTFPGGVFVAAGDFNGDGRAEIVTGPDVGGGPHVRVLQFVRAGDPDFVPGVTNIYNNVRNFSSDIVSLPANFNAYDPNFHGGVRVAVGDVDGDGRPDIVTGAGIGGGPHVKVFSGANGAVFRSFLAYAPNFLGGVYVAAGDYNQDGKADILTGAGVGGAPHVEVFSGATIVPTLLAGFLAFPPGPPSPIIPDPNASTGVGSVAFTDANGDGQLDILVGTARGPQSRALVFRGPGFTPILSPQDELLISPTLHDGANVAGNAFVISGP